MHSHPLVSQPPLRSPQADEEGLAWSSGPRGWVYSSAGGSEPPPGWGTAAWFPAQCRAVVGCGLWGLLTPPLLSLRASVSSAVTVLCWGALVRPADQDGGGLWAGL